MNGKSATILIVDDEPTNITIMAQALKDDYDLIVATSGEQALARASSGNRPNLILLDIIMPGMDGFEVCRRLKADAKTKDIPVIFTTAMSDRENEQRGLELGAVDYIMKPVNPAILQSRVQSFLEIRGEPLRRANILVVDDVPANLEIAASTLESEAYNILLAASGAEALAKTSQLLVDLVLLDVMMPEVDGFEVCRRLKADPRTRDVPVIMLTAKADPESIIKGFKAGAQDYVAKPFNDEELHARVRTHLELRFKSEQIKKEKEKSERLLLNILPRKVVQDLRELGRTEVQDFKDVTVLFADIVDFTRKSSGLPPRLIINELNEIFTAFDEIVATNGGERIKTIGDAYLAVCGMPVPNPCHAEIMLRTAIELRDHLKRRNATPRRVATEGWTMRFGLHSGEAVGGVVGIKKYIYDIFGDAINTASRMESCGEPMRINVSESTWNLTRQAFCFEERPPAEVKGKGLMRMFYAERFSG